MMVGTSSWCFIMVVCFLAILGPGVVVMANNHFDPDSSKKKPLDEKGHRVRFRFELSREPAVCNFQWRVVSKVTDDSSRDRDPFISSCKKEDTQDDKAEHSQDVFLVELSLMEEFSGYSVILHCAEAESTMVYEDPFPAFVNVTLFSDHENRIIFSKRNLRLDSTTYEIPLSIETPTDLNGSRLLKASEYKEFLDFPPVRGIGSPGDDERPPPPTHRPTTEPAPKPTSAPKPPSPGPTPKPVPQPTPSPEEGGGGGGGGEPTPVPAATPSDSMAPTTFSALKPSFYSGNTSAPSISHAPSLSPTIEPPCTSTTSGPIPFDDKYIAIKLHVKGIQESDMTQNATDTFLAALVESYNAIAACDQKGASRRLDQAFVDRVTEFFSGYDVEWIVRLTGVCEGCIMSAESLFSAENDTTTLNSTYQFPLNTTSANGTVLTGTPCFCPGPLIWVFQDNLNQLLQYNTTETTTILNVVELENDQSCDSALLPQAGLAPEQHDTLVTLVIHRNPSEITEDDFQSMITSFIQVVHSHLSLTYPTCDLSRKRIVDIQPDPSNPIIGRKLLCPRPNSCKNNHRVLQQTSADFELVLKVTFTCFGCEGRLFGRTNFTPNYDCLCPKDADHFGVNEKEILAALNDALAQLSIESVSDIIEIAQVPCSSTIHEFSTVAVIEYILRSNGTLPTDGDLAVLEDEFVAGYNGIARRYCDPYFRRIISATTVDNYKISNDGLKLNVEMSILGTCRGNCSSDINIYDSNAFFAGLDIGEIANVSSTTISAHQRNRHLQTEPGTTCYCSVAASKELGPSEPEIVTNFRNLVDQLTLESVRDVATCRALTFRTGFFLTVPATLANATKQELNQIGQTFVDSYNQQTQQEGLCDEYFRKILHIRVDGNPALNSTFNVRAFDNGEILSDRMILTRTLFRPTRRIQNTESESPSMAPTLQPSILGKNDTFAPFLPLPVISNVSFFVEVSGVCQGCSMSIGLFDQVSARRRNLEAQENEIDNNNILDKLVTTNGNFSCFCPPESTRVELSDEAVTQALSSLSFVNGTVGLQQVEIVDCSVEVNTFQTTTPLDFLVNGDILPEDEDFIASGFITTYIELSEEYCDSLFRRLQEVNARFQITSGPDQNGVSTVRFWLDLQGTCRGCTGLETLFDSNRRRMQMQERQEEVCFCNKDAVPRAPTDEEFQEAFAKYLGSGRRLQQNSKFVLLCIGSTCPDLPVGLLPSMSPTIINLVNPFGIQNYPGCVVPVPSFVGDGFCDRALDANELPIYNKVECGYDGGDCCESTCTGYRFECGSGGYWCIDDQAVNNVFVTTCADQAGTLLGDGVCDLDLNIPFCAYDEGDCCESTCGLLHGIVCLGPFPTCVDPNAVENAPSAAPTLMPSSSQFPSFAPTRAPTLAPSDAPTVSPTQAPSFAPTTQLTKTCKTCGISDSAFCGDGYCDNALNSAFCGWDGGDCCQQTCVSTVFTCPTSVNEYVCRDPDYNGLPASCHVSYPEWVGDGVCDVYFEYNVAGCNFDGGDCCENTCVKQDVDDCQYFYCLERLPEACAAHFRLSAPLFIGDTFFPPWWVGDGYCDYMYNYPQDNPYNTAECLWDMGDCCGDTCKSSDYICGLDSPFYCIDPNSPFHTDLTLPEPPVGCTVPDPEWLGDGWCDHDMYGYNTAACGWDLGDCCGQTCSDAPWFHPYDCGIAGYICLDPRFPHPPDVSSACQVTSPQFLGDGLCDSGVPNYNSAACGWDLGDCCPQTCLAAQSQWYHKWECGDGGYECLDPDAPKPPDVASDCTVSDPSYLGDGYCDGGAYNTDKCLWDFGDCCNQTCHHATWYHTYDCGINGYNCLDLSVPKPPSVPSGCNVGVPAFLGDGKCDSAEYNTEVCGWDLGDCCEQTCLAAKAGGYHQYECGSYGYNCSDTSKPTVPELCDAPDQSKLGDGRCDYDGEYNYNTQVCGWDFGDCCAQTCFASSWYQTYPCGVNGYNCFDPSVDQGPTKPPIPVGCSVEYPDFLGDGGCDDGAYNTEACNWDFGDCCKKSCTMAEWFQGYSCGSFGYNCLDPHRASWDYVNVMSIENTLPYAYWSGGYRSASGYLFGAPVYFDGFTMLYWCKDEGRWTIQRDGDIAQIAANGCKGQGFMSVPQENAASICDAIWKDETGAVVLWICGETCPPCSGASLAYPAQSISMSLKPTSFPTFSPFEFPSKLPAMFPSNFPSVAPSKAPVTSTLAPEFPSEFPSEFPFEFPSEFPTEGPKDV